MTGPRNAVYVAPASDPTGPYAVADAIEGLPDHLYSGRLVQGPDGDWVWLAFIEHDRTGAFVGELSDPVPYPWSDSGGDSPRS